MKKKSVSLNSVLLWFWKSKFGMKMRVTIILLLVCAGQILAIGTYAQNKRVSIKMANVPIKNVLEAIENRSEFYFMYEAHKVNVEKEVSVSADNKKFIRYAEK